LRIVELSAFVAVPLGGATLAAMGADVIRIDPPGGGLDIDRAPVWNGTSLYWAGLNQGKRSMTIDMKTQAGQSLVRRLVASGGPGGGIVITNLGDRGWNSYTRLAEARPDLIMLVLTGNPDGSPAVDYTVNAALGFPMVTGPKETREPVNHVLPAWDGMAGFLVATGVLAAERHRALTGEGQRVSLSLAEVGLAVTARLGILAEAQLDPQPRGRHGNYVFGTFGRDFLTRDGRHLMVVALTPRQWQSVLDATGLSSEFADLEARTGLDFRQESARWQEREAISARLVAWIGARDLADVRRGFDDAHVLWAPYQTFKDLLADEKAPAAISPLGFGRFPRGDIADPPRLGQHTDEVLAEILAMPAAEIDALHDEGIV
jgi:2-methylfumaryl-CoA isomerase